MLYSDKKANRIDSVGFFITFLNQDCIFLFNETQDPALYAL